MTTQILQVCVAVNASCERCEKGVEVPEETVSKLQAPHMIAVFHKATSTNDLPLNVLLSVDSMSQPTAVSFERNVRISPARVSTVARAASWSAGTRPPEVKLNEKAIDPRAGANTKQQTGPQEDQDAAANGNVSENSQRGSPSQKGQSLLHVSDQSCWRYVVSLSYSCFFASADGERTS